MAKAKTVRKRREKKNIERGTAHIRSSFNNTIVTMSDINGNALSELCRSTQFQRLQEVHSFRSTDGGGNSG